LPTFDDANLLVGTRSPDDAAVYRMDAGPALVATVDFFTPIVDDGYTYGRIAAINALSDIYAMGGRPFLALNVVGFPLGELPEAVLGEILKGGANACLAEGVALAGGHTVRSPEVLYGLAVLGLVDPARVVTKRGARPGDALVLTKALGTGILATALKAGDCPAAAARAAEVSMLTSNRVAAAAMLEAGAVCATDVTGFGLLGHAWEIAQASGVGVRFRAGDVPALPGAREMAGRYAPGGLRENRKFVAPHLVTGPGVDEDTVNLLADPQTSGGLLVALPPERAAALAERLGEPARIIGEIIEAPTPALEVIK